MWLKKQILINNTQGTQYENVLVKWIIHVWTIYIFMEQGLSWPFNNTNKGFVINCLTNVTKHVYLGHIPTALVLSRTNILHAPCLKDKVSY